MDFKAAFDLLINGFKVTRESWDKDHYMFLKGEDVIEHESFDAISFIDGEELLANDWLIYDDGEVEFDD